MAKVRIATGRLDDLSRKTLLEALKASLNEESNAAFYSIVGMRNPSRSYYVQYGGRQHSLKAVVAYALRQLDPSITSRDFHAVDAANLMRRSNFVVEHTTDVVTEKRERKWIEQLARNGQSVFRARLIDLYGRCPLSGCSTLFALEAVHVNQVKKHGSDATANGILLRADIHKLFDTDQIAINPVDGTVSLSLACRNDYNSVLRDRVYIPIKGGLTLKAFTQRWIDFNATHGTIDE